METFLIKDLKGSKTDDIVVGLGEWRVVLGVGQVTETVNEVDGIGEEDVVVHEYLLLLSLVGVKGHQVAVYYCYGTFNGGIQKVIVYFLNSSISLDSLHECILWEILDYLVLFIPVSDSLWVKPIQRNEVSRFIFVDLVWFRLVEFFFLNDPVMDW